MNRLYAFKAVFFVVYTAVVALIVLEGTFLLLLHVPRLTAAAPRSIRRLAQQVYRHFNRNLIQFDPNCAVYDPGVTYTLKPGSCTFSNLEFSNQYDIDRAGTRDTDAALQAPEVIVIGDSHAMGWGVNQNEATPQRLAVKTGLRVLNAAISSYGTVRERLLLERLDASKMRFLVLQYTDNDLIENRAFVEHGGTLPITSEAEYDRIVKHYARQSRYFPGKYTFRLLMKVTRLEEPEPDQTSMAPASPAEEADLFLNALQHAGRTPLDNIQVIVYEINEQIRPARPFIAALADAHKQSKYPEYIRKLIPIDVAPLLSPADFYVLDDHMNANGHDIVSTALANVIRASAAGAASP